MLANSPQTFGTDAEGCGLGESADCLWREGRVSVARDGDRAGSLWPSGIGTPSCRRATALLGTCAMEPQVRADRRSGVRPGRTFPRRRVLAQAGRGESGVPPGNANLRSGAASGALGIVGERVSACLGRVFFGLCLCAFRFAHRHFASRRVSAAGWGKPGIHQFKPKENRHCRQRHHSSP